jgi:protein SCO1/2
MLPRAPRLTFAICLLGLGLASARAEEVPDPHAHHHQMMNTMKRAQRSTADYAVPQVTLVRDDGKAVSLPAELDDGRPVVLDFIYTTCTTICPLLSQTFTQLQERLGDERGKVHMMSISIDPEEDTPARLAEYARRFHAGPQWRHYTGTVEASVATQRAFHAYRGDKMAHTPVTFLRASPGKPWVRIDGFASPDELARELRQLVAAR